MVPLHIASVLGNNDIVTLLLENGALVDLPGRLGTTSLHLALL